MLFQEKRRNESAHHGYGDVGFVYNYGLLRVDLYLN